MATNSFEVTGPATQAVVHHSAWTLERARQKALKSGRTEGIFLVCDEGMLTKAFLASKSTDDDFKSYVRTERDAASAAFKQGRTPWPYYIIELDRRQVLQFANPLSEERILANPGTFIVLYYIDGQITFRIPDSWAPDSWAP